MADYISNKTCEEIDAILDSATPKGEVGDAPDMLTLQGARSYAEVLSKASLICAGRITALYTTGWATIGAKVEISDAFKAKYGDNAPTITEVVLVDKRVSGNTPASTTRFLFSGDYEGCYFVMEDFEGNDTIFKLGATKGDWIIAQNKSWAKIVTTRRDIAGIEGEVTANALAHRLSTAAEDNTKPLATKEELSGFVKGVKVNDEVKTPDTDGIVDLGNIEGGGNYVTTLVYKATSKVENVQIPWDDSTFGASIIRHEYDEDTGVGVIYFNGRITTIGNAAFYNCHSLTSVTIPDSVTTIENNAFSNCSILTSVTIPDSVTKIGIAAFGGCRILTSVTIPDSITTIEDNAFSGCRNLTSVYCKAVTPPAGGSLMFSGNASGRKIYVPTESVEVYKSAYGWSDYADAIVGYRFNIDPNDYYTKEEVNSAIATAITTTLNTPV